MSPAAIRRFQLGRVGTAEERDTLPLGEERALQSAGAAFHALADTMPQMVWSTLPDGSHDYFNARWYEFTGVPEGSTDGEGWAGVFHEDDQPIAWKHWSHSLASGEPYEVEYRLRRHDGEYRWMIGRALPIVDEAGVIQRWIGTCTDIEDQKRISLQNEVLSQELSHRIKNIFAIISGLISLTARTSEAFAEPASKLKERIAALGRAHEFVRPHTEKSRPSVGEVTLAALLETIFETYPAFSEGRIEISGPQIEVDSKAATPVALVFHELATNSMKYGALKHDHGHVRIDIEQNENEVAMRWAETGSAGRPDEEPEPGFGTRLIDIAIRQQLGGTFQRKWTDDGMTLDMQVKRSRIAATG